MGVTAAIISAIVGVAGVGTSIYEGEANRSAQSDAQKASQQALLQQQRQAAAQADLQKKEAVLGASGQTQAQTGGSLTDEGTAALTALLAGYPGYQGGTSGGSGTSGTPGTTGALVNGSGSGTSTGTGVGSSGIPGSGSGGTPDIAAILSALRNGTGGNPFGSGSSGSNISGGNWPAPSSSPANQPQRWQELSNPVL